MGIKVFSIFFSVLISMIGCTNIKNDEKIIIKEKNNYNETKDVVYINDNILMTNYDIDGRAEDVNLLDEYKFLNNILEQNNAESSREIKIYLREYEGQEREEYSKFQENTIIYKLKNDDNNFVEMNFSENMLLGDCIHNLEESYNKSVINNETVSIFEYFNPENQSNVTGLAYFTINGLIFRIKGYNISHENFVKIIKTTIKSYREI